MKELRSLIAVVFIMSVATVLFALVFPGIDFGKHGVDGIGWLVLRLQDYLRNVQHQSQVFVIGFFFASVTLILWIILPRLARVRTTSS